MNFRKLLNEQLEEWLLVAGLILITCLVMAQVFFRYVMDASVGWSEELARYLLIWIAWISASYAIQKKAHIQVDIFKNMLNDTSKKIIELVALVVFFVMAIFLAVEGTNLVLSVNATNQVSPSLKIPMWAVYLAIPVGGILMSIRLIQQGIRILSK